MKNKDKGRKWMWWFLAAVVLLQLYFVQELLAAFALFAIGFVAIASVVVTMYMAQKTWEVAVEKVAASNHPAVNWARRSAGAVEDFARRPFRIRRPGSEPAR
jgi:hypothetical protein